MVAIKRVGYSVYTMYNQLAVFVIPSTYKKLSLLLNVDNAQWLIYFLP